MSNPDVDDYVAAKLPPQHHDTVARLRALMAAGAPGASEAIVYGSPAWRGNKVLAIVSPTKTHITFAFERGAEFDDPFGLLQGSGKQTRHVKLKNADAIDDEALRHYIAQAVEHDRP